MNIAMKRSIYTNKKLSVEFFMYEPTGSYSDYKDTRYVSINANPVLILKSYTGDSYKINPRNLYKIIKFFNKIVRWFDEGTGIKDLFVIDEDNKLIFNSGYKDIYAIINKGPFETNMLKAMPCVIEREIGSNEEGIMLYVNDISHIIYLNIEEIYTIYNILKDFSFVEEMMFTISTINYLDSKSRIIKFDPTAYQGKWTT